MRIETDRLAIEVADSGRLDTVALTGRSAEPLVTELDLGSCRLDGAEVDWTSRTIALDADEVSVWVAAADLEVQLRHSFATGFTTRLLIVNTGTAAHAIDRLQLRARPVQHRAVSALAAGARLCWATQASSGEGPLLTARLGSGSVNRVTDEGFELGPLRLAPGQRYVTQLRWELFATPRSVVAGPGRDVLVSRTVYVVDEAVLLPGDPDAALVVPPGVSVDPVDEPEVSGREVVGYEQGRHRIELRSAEGDVRLDLSWVESLSEQLLAWAESVLDGPRTSAGVVMIDQLPAAIVVQAAVRTDGLTDADLAADALDRLTAQLLDRWSDEPDRTRSGPDSLALLYLLSEHGRTGDSDALELAFSIEQQLLAADGPPPPGLGLAVLRTVLAGVDAPERVAPLVGRAVARVTVLAERGISPAPGSAEQAAELELLLAVRPLLPPDHPAHHQLVAGVRAVGAALGSGLPGRLVQPPPVAEHAHLVTVLRMLPEDGIAGATPSWGASPTLLAHRLTLEVLDRLTGADVPIGPAAAWLALGQRRV